MTVILPALQAHVVQAASSHPDRRVFGDSCRLRPTWGKRLPFHCRDVPRLFALRRPGSAVWATNGPVWVEQLAISWPCRASEPSLAGGTDFGLARASRDSHGVGPLNAKHAEPRHADRPLSSNVASSLHQRAAAHRPRGGQKTSMAGRPIHRFPSRTSAKNSPPLPVNGGRYFLVANLPPLGDTPDADGRRARPRWLPSMPCPCSSTSLQPRRRPRSRGHSASRSTVWMSATIFNHVVQNPSSLRD